MQTVITCKNSHFRPIGWWPLQQFCTTVQTVIISSTGSVKYELLSTDRAFIHTFMALQQAVVWHNYCKSIYFGIWQGSVLSPVLFTVYIDSIINYFGFDLPSKILNKKVAIFSNKYARSGNCRCRFLSCNCVDATRCWIAQPNYDLRLDALCCCAIIVHCCFFIYHYGEWILSFYNCIMIQIHE